MWSIGNDADYGNGNQWRHTSPCPYGKVNKGVCVAHKNALPQSIFIRKNKVEGSASSDTGIKKLHKRASATISNQEINSNKICSISSAYQRKNVKIKNHGCTY